MLKKIFQLFSSRMLRINWRGPNQVSVASRCVLERVVHVGASGARWSEWCTLERVRVDRRGLMMVGKAQN